MNLKKLSVVSAVLLPILLICIIPSCKKYVDPPPYFEDTIATVKPVLRKVLIIGVDGAVGAEYKTIQPPVLVGLQAHSKYSWDAVSDESTTDAASWKTLMTGISFGRHLIQDSSFIYSPPAGSNTHGSSVAYPSFFSYILSSSRPDIKTTFISQWPELVNRLVPEVEDKLIVASDAAVKDSAVARVKRANAELVLVNFNSVAIAGKTHSFSATAAGYRTAVLTVDGYIGEIMTALKSRPEYNKNEEWLVIITGTHGGVGTTYGGPSEKEANVFSFYYNERLKPLELTKAGSFAGVEIKGLKTTGVKAQVLNDGGFYDPGTSPQTVQLKIKGGAIGFYPHFFAKRTEFRTTSGWTCFGGGSGSEWYLDVKNNAGAAVQLPGGAIFDNQWHTISIVFFADSIGTTNKYLRIYRDGNRVGQANITGWNITSPAPLTIGSNATTDGNYSIPGFYSADATIFKTALTDAEIRDNLCLRDITQHPKYANLAGYWPANDAFGGRLKNKVAGNKDFILQGDFKWSAIADLPCTTLPNANPNVASLLVKSVDLVPTVFYWLRMPTATSWGLEGSSWLSQYEIEFVKL